MTQIISGAQLRTFATPSDVHVDALMTAFAINYGNLGFSADEFMPYVPVKKQSDKFAVFNSDRRQERVPNTLRAPRTAAKVVDWSVDLTKTYACLERALAAGVDDQERDNSDDVILPDQRATLAALVGLLLDREDRVATLLTTAANYAAGHNTTLAGVNQWSDPANSNPKSDVDAARDKIATDAGVLPNVMGIPWGVVQKLKLHNKITDAFKYTQGGVITTDMLANYFEVERIVITGAVKNTAAEGQAAALSRIWGKDVFLLYVSRDTSPLRGMTFGKSFRWSQALGDRITRTFRDDKARTDWFEVDEAVDEKITASEAGYVIKAAIA